MLQVLDAQWKDHLHTMDGLREGIGLRGYAQKDPKVEYQREGFALFAETEQRMDEQAAERCSSSRCHAPPSPALEARAAGEHEPAAAAPARTAVARARRGAARSAGRGGRGARSGKVGRNDPCPCGSGKKYKKCCGQPERRVPLPGDPK